MALTPPFKLEHIDHVVLLVEGMERAVRFYEEVIGASVERRLEKFALVQMRAGSSLIDLLDIASEEGAWAEPDVEGGRNVDHVALAIDDVDPDALKAHLAAHDVKIEEEGIRYGAKGNTYSWYIRDPFGHLIELKSSIRADD